MSGGVRYQRDDGTEAASDYRIDRFWLGKMTPAEATQLDGGEICERYNAASAALRQRGNAVRVLALIVNRSEVERIEAEEDAGGKDS